MIRGLYRNRLCLAALLLCLLAPAPEAWADTRGLFGTDERKSSRLKSFPKWREMLKRHEDGGNTESTSCGNLSGGQCNIAHWNAFLNSVRGQGFISQVKAVNSHMNRHRYIIDPINWGVPDYWATPYQFFIKNGDCEDYAISKYMSLRALGVSEDDLRIVVLEDKNLNIMHAVLAVYSGGDIYILDNQIKSVVKDTAIHHYKPIYSINESAWWRHSK